MKKPLNIAHRGASGHAPENTMAAFRTAIDMGADMIELDTHLSADGKLIVMHDGKVDRTTEGTGAIAAMQAADIVKLDAGRHFSDKFAGEHPPTLEQVIELCKGKVQLNVEVKGSPGDYGRLEQALVELLRQAEFTDQVVVSAFKHKRLAILDELEPSLRTAKLIVTRPAPITPSGYFDRTYAIHPHWSGASSAFIEKAHKNGSVVNVWTINARSRMLSLAERGADGIIGNYPDLVNETFA